jgi:DNA-binding NtrC family response regulator
VYFQNVPEAATRVQRRLARVFRDREVALADTGETIPLDVRPIVGVAPEIDSLVQEGRVREDLFRRVSAIRIEMPPLRNRREDIPALAEHFVREVCSARCAPLKTISGAALALVAALPWRGNAIELRTLIDNVVAGLGNERSIDLEDLLAHVRLDGAPAVWPAGGTLKEARARFEREYIAAVLEQHHGRISQAAKALGIQRTNLYRKLRVLRLEYQNKTH